MEKMIVETLRFPFDWYVMRFSTINAIPCSAVNNHVPLPSRPSCLRNQQRVGCGHGRPSRRQRNHLLQPGQWQPWHGSGWPLVPITTRLSVALKRRSTRTMPAGQRGEIVRQLGNGSAKPKTTWHAGHARGCKIDRRTRRSSEMIDICDFAVGLRQLHGRRMPSERPAIACSNNGIRWGQLVSSPPSTPRRRVGVEAPGGLRRPRRLKPHRNAAHRDRCTENLRLRDGNPPNVWRVALRGDARPDRRSHDERRRLRLVSAMDRPPWRKVAMAVGSRPIAARARRKQRRPSPRRTSTWHCEPCVRIDRNSGQRCTTSDG